MQLQDELGTIYQNQSFTRHFSHCGKPAETAKQLGFTTLCANDHLISSRPWLDSVTPLAFILTKTPRMKLMN